MTIHVNAAAAERVGEEFLALILADHDLLAAEFDAIMDASWTERPPNQQRPLRVPLRMSPRAVLSAPPAASDGKPHPGPAGRADGWLRGRSPPSRIRP